MRIAFVSAFYPFRGGIAQFSENLYLACRDLPPFQPQAFTFTRQYPNWLFPGKSQFVESQDRIAVERGERVGALRVLDTVNPLNWRSAARKVLEQDPQVVVFRFWTSLLSPSMGSMARYLRHKNPKIKLVAFIDNGLPHERKFYDVPLTRWFVKPFDAFVVMSKAVHQDLAFLDKEVAAGSKPVLLRPHPFYNHFGAAIERSVAQKQLGLDPSLRTLLFFGFIRPYKGLDIAIEAMSLLGDNYQLLIVGECYGSFEPYQQAIDSSPARDRIKVERSFIADESVPLYFSAADLCVQPYRTATQSGISATSFCFDLPLVVTDVGGLKEAISASGTGIVADEVSAAGVARAIESYFNIGRLSFIPAIAKEKESHSWSAFAQALLHFFETILT